jgi:hypothetical protein
MRCATACCLEHGWHGGHCFQIPAGLAGCHHHQQLLYLLIVLVGIDLVELKLGSAWRTPR